VVRVALLSKITFEGEFDMSTNIKLDTEIFSQPTLVVVEQKGSDEVECRERFMAGCAIFEQLKEFSADAYLMIVGGANNGVQPETIKGWCPAKYFDQLIISNSAGNTQEKGVSIAAYVKEHSIANIIQVTSLYHSLRAFLTTVKAMQNASVEPAFYNSVCDSTSPDVIKFALLDEILIAQGVGPTLQFITTDETYAEYLAAAGAMKLDAGLQKFLFKRYGESRRISDYSEEGKDHLTTNITSEAVVATYLI
jgi:hypothetical protein